MKAIILAAGVGRRLKTSIPKTLIEIGDDKTFISNILDNLRLVGIREIICVVGYKKELIMEKYPDLLYVYNPRFAFTNTGVSLRLVLNSIDPDDLLIINGDVYFRESNWFNKLVNADGNLIAVKKVACGDEEVKVQLDESGKVVDISKNILPEKAYGEAVGVYKIKKSSFHLLRKFISLLNDDDFYEKAFSLMIENGEEFRLLDIDSSFCIEVDFPEDLEILKKKA